MNEEIPQIRLIKAIIENAFSDALLEYSNDLGYELSLMEDIKGKILETRVYLEKYNDKLKYKLINRIYNKIVIGYIDIKIDDDFLKESHIRSMRAKIFKELKKTGHLSTIRCQNMVQKEIARDFLLGKNYSLLPYYLSLIGVDEKSFIEKADKILRLDKDDFCDDIKKEEGIKFYMNYLTTSQSKKPIEVKRKYALDLMYNNYIKNAIKFSLSVG